MSKLTETHIEKLAIEELINLGYTYQWGPEIAPDGEYPERESYKDVLLNSRLQAAVQRINLSIPADAQNDALKQIQRLNSPELLTNNEAFHRMLTEGINVTYQKNGSPRGDLVWLIDFKHPENNEFLAVNQFTVIENGKQQTPRYCPVCKWHSTGGTRTQKCCR
jgi:type I restriction enzyme, R subunit